MEWITSLLNNTVPELKLQAESMGVFQHDGPVVIGWLHRECLGHHKTSGFINNQVEIVPFPGIVPDPEIPDKGVIQIIELNESTGR